MQVLDIYLRYMTNNKQIEDKTKILDPFNTIVKLAILGFKSPGSKLSISNHNIYLFQPSYYQGFLRTIYGDTKEDLHYLLNPIYLSSINYLNENTKNIFELARRGLLLLKDTYKYYNIINHTLDLYIYILTNSINSVSENTNNNLDYSFVKIDEELAKKYTYNWKESEINIIINIFNLIIETKDNNMHYIESIEKLMIPIDECISRISHI